MVSGEKGITPAERTLKIKTEEVMARIQGLRRHLDELNARLDAVKSDRDDVLMALAEAECELDAFKQGQLPLGELDGEVYSS